MTRSRTLVSLALLVSSLAAQQFAEVGKAYMPKARPYGWSVATADVDGDGDLDLAFGSTWMVNGAHTLLYLNDGSGHFKDVTRQRMPLYRGFTGSVAFGDVDGDNDQDLVCANDGQSRLYLNDGTGTFVDATVGRIPIASIQSWTQVLRDLDNDGDLDLVLGSRGGQTRYYQNNGLGVFTDVTATHFVLRSDTTEDITVGDVDGDNDLDLVIANYAGQPRLYLNDGTGKFADATAQLPGQALNCGAIVLVNVDGDNDLDLVLGMWHGQHRLWLNNGAGVFSDGTTGRMPLGTSDNTWKVRVGDFDKDGDQDLLFVSASVHRLFQNDGAGLFTDVTAQKLDLIPDTGVDAVVADFDKDGDLDIAASEGGNWQQLLINDGAGRFALATPNAIPASYDEVRMLAYGDFDKDGDLDLVAAISGVDLSQNLLRLNDGLGHFVDVTATHLPADDGDTRGVVVGDFDKDGDLDLVFANMATQSRLLLNDGLAHFSDATATRLPQGAQPTSCIVSGDVDNDGDLDLMVGNFGAPSQLWLNDGTGKFVDATPGHLPGSSLDVRALAFADVDKDGDLDLLVGLGGNAKGQARLWINDGAGHYTDATASRMPAVLTATASIAVGDIDGDNDLDVVLSDDGPLVGGYNALLLNDGTGTFTDATGSRLKYYYANTRALLLGDFDEDGDLDLIVADYDLENRYYENVGGFFSRVLERMPDSIDNALCLTAFDADQDGDLDLVSGNFGSVTGATVLYTNHHRQLTAPLLAQIGKPFTMECYSRPTYAAAPATAALFVAPGLLPQPLILTPFGKLHLDPLLMIPLGTTTIAPLVGFSTTTVVLPNNSALLGQPLAAQALVLPSANLAEARLTNALLERITR